MTDWVLCQVLENRKKVASQIAHKLAQMVIRNMYMKRWRGNFDQDQVFCFLRTRMVNDSANAWNGMSMKCHMECQVYLRGEI